jgi:hypothetical protein
LFNYFPKIRAVKSIIENERAAGYERSEQPDDLRVDVPER